MVSPSPAVVFQQLPWPTSSIFHAKSRSDSSASCATSSLLLSSSSSSPFLPEGRNTTKLRTDDILAYGQHMQQTLIVKQLLSVTGNTTNEKPSTTDTIVAYNCSTQKQMKFHQLKHFSSLAKPHPHPPLVQKPKMENSD
ncbi:hypothetical protein V6N13_146176 [Hibiscus sabdariffa]|uniref:Uncharacterized protein n=1 Tax=Hibiscus sabdariffa TaxID=183260 RepID=A0ABR2TS65_9ROSI